MIYLTPKLFTYLLLSLFQPSAKQHEDSVKRNFWSRSVFIKLSPVASRLVFTGPESWPLPLVLTPASTQMLSSVRTRHSREPAINVKSHWRLRGGWGMDFYIRLAAQRGCLTSGHVQAFLWEPSSESSCCHGIAMLTVSTKRLVDPHRCEDQDKVEALFFRHVWLINQPRRDLEPFCIQ